MKKIIKNIIYLSVLIITILLNSSCEPTYYRHYKLNKMYIIQNILNDSLINKYDSLKFKIIHDSKPDYMMDDGGDIRINLIDYYKTINFFTVNDYNTNYMAGSNINEIISLIYYSYTYLAPSCIDSLINYNHVCSSYDCEPCNEWNYSDKDTFPNVDQFMADVSCKRANPIELTLNTPPNGTVLFQIRAEIELLDGRQFILYSEPVYIKP